MGESAHPGKFHASITFDDRSGLSRDRAVNNFHFTAATVPSPNFGNMRDLVLDFYRVTPAGEGGPVRSLLSPMLTGAWEFKVYDLTQDPPRVPVFIDMGTIADMGDGNVGAPLPREVALKHSINATYIPGVDKQRQQGGFYLGPLAGGVNVVTGDGTHATRPAAALLSRCRKALRTLIDAADASSDVDFVVASLGARDNSVSSGHPGDAGYVLPKNRPLLPPKYFIVSGGWVDDEFDTIRRRGLRPTSRGTV